MLIRKLRLLLFFLLVVKHALAFDHGKDDLIGGKYQDGP
jgi:hypothetical protein